MRGVAGASGRAVVACATGSRRTSSNTKHGRRSRRGADGCSRSKAHVTAVAAAAAGILSTEAGCMQQAGVCSDADSTCKRSLLVATR